jgi:hypothetical protein
MPQKTAALPYPEVFLSTTETSKEVGRRVRRGELRKIGPSLYTPNLADSEEAIVGRNLWRVVALLAPGTVVSHRTALTNQPTAGKTVFVTGAYPRLITLPGVRIRVLKGPGPLPYDTPLPDGLYQSSRARAFLECLGVERVRGTESPAPARAEVEERLERLVAVGGEAQANDLRERARELAPLLGKEEAARTLDAMVGALLLTRAVRFEAPAAVARAAGEPYDTFRDARFALLAGALRDWVSADRPDRGDGGEWENLSFFDAYFSNYIEGTEFEVDEAAAIVFDHRIPEARPADAHDVLGTYRVVSSRHTMRAGTAGLSWPQFEAYLLSRHETIMQGRPDVRPGAYKGSVNRAGDTFFVAPDQVRATLRRGLGHLATLEHPFARAVYVMFLVSEIHPFDDGNGRVARALMNAELVAGGQRRILIPTAFRDDYIGALRRLSRHDDPEVVIHALDRAQRFTAAVDFRDFAAAERTLRECGAFEGGRDARLRMPPAAGPA